MKTNIGKDILDIYPDAILDTTIKGPLKSYLIPSEGMVVETTKDDKIIRIYDPLKIDDEEEGLEGFNEHIINLP